MQRFNTNRMGGSDNCFQLSLYLFLFSEHYGRRYFHLVRMFHIVKDLNVKVLNATVELWEMKTGHADVMIGFTKAKPKISPYLSFYCHCSSVHFQRAG